MRSIRVFSVASALCLVAACSGAAGSNLLGPTGSGSSSGGSGGSSGGSSGGHGGSSSGRSGSGSGGSSGVGTDAGSSSSSGGEMDASVMDVIEAGNGDPGVWCGQNMYCDPNTQWCCVGGQMQAQVHMCQQVNDNCVGATVQCDDTADCPMGMVCCGQIDPQTQMYTQVQCAGDCSQFDQGQRQFCDPNVPNECTVPGHPNCDPSTLMPGYHACR